MKSSKDKVKKCNRIFTLSKPDLPLGSYSGILFKSFDNHAYHNFLVHVYFSVNFMSDENEDESNEDSLCLCQHGVLVVKDFD